MQDGIEEGSLGVPMSRINNSSRRDDPLESMWEAVFRFPV